MTILRLITWIANRSKYRVIDGGCSGKHGPLLVRYFIAGGNESPFGIYLHQLCRSDIERHFHDHPWAFVSIILRGGYTEHTPQGSTAYGAGSVLVRPARWQHKLQMDDVTWTLVIRFPKVRRWGFITERGWVHWDQYDYNADC